MTVSAKRLAWLALIPAVMALYVFFALWFPIGSDYFFFFRPKPIEVFQGTSSLYDGTGTDFGSPPWSVPVFGLTSLLPLRFGQAVVTMVTITALVVATPVFQRKNERWLPLYMMLAIVNVHTFDLLLRSNIDGFALLGLALTWMGYQQERPLLLGVGFWLISFKPVHLVLYSLLVLWGIRKWPWRSWVWVLAPLGLSGVLSTIIMGPRWLYDFVYYNAFEILPFVELQTSLWRLIETAGLPVNLSLVFTGVTFSLGLVFIVTRRQVDRWAAILMLTLNSFFSPYSMGYHYVVHAPVLYVLILRDRRFMLLWLLTLTPLLRLWWGFSYVWVDSFYVLGLLISAVYVYWRYQQSQRTQPQTDPEESESVPATP